jgi:hypothetical protein
MLVEEDIDIDADVSIGGRPNVEGGEARRSCRVEKSRICTDDDDACDDDDGAARSPVLLATTLPL